jgi:hypothetical protein
MYSLNRPRSQFEYLAKRRTQTNRASLGMFVPHEVGFRLLTLVIVRLTFLLLWVRARASNVRFDRLTEATFDSISSSEKNPPVRTPKGSDILVGERAWRASTRRRPQSRL